MYNCKKLQIFTLIIIFLIPFMSSDTSIQRSSFDTWKKETTTSRVASREDNRGSFDTRKETNNKSSCELHPMSSTQEGDGRSTQGAPKTKEIHTDTSII